LAAESSTAVPPFGRLRALLWPLYRHEVKKFIPMLVMAFLITYNYNILRGMKDPLVITAKSSGAEVIPFIKVWVLLPSAFLMTYLFTRLSNRFNMEQVFYWLVSVFLGFFILFTFVIYPYSELLHPHAAADALQDVLPVGLGGLIALFRHWTFSLFYVMSELWGTTVLTLLFWGFANEVTRVDEAKRFYGLIGLASNAASIFAGGTSVALSNKALHLDEGPGAWQQALVMQTVVVVIMGIGIMVIYRWFNRVVLTDPRFCDQEKRRRDRDEASKIKMSMRANFAYLARSRYLRNIAIIVFAYNVVINLVEVLWKHQVKQLYPDTTQYNIYMGYVTAATGVVAVIGAFFVSAILRRFRWSAGALITPLMLLVTSIGFFGFMLWQDRLTWLTTLMGTSPLAMVVLFGSAQNCLCRASKYTIFDATKEMSFIPLSQESRRKGKAVIDVVGSRFGKSSGSVIHQGLLVAFSTLTASAPYVGGILMGIIVLWMGSVRSLGRKFTQLTNSQNAAVPVTTSPPSDQQPEPVKV
jgi:ATP:ADP antiporter, AAA family